MKRKLIYYLYIAPNFEKNISYSIHKVCLKKYIHNFDSAIFWVTLDDLSDTEFRQKAFNWILSIIGNIPFEIKFKENTYLREALMFQEEILDKLDSFKNELIYFAHNKSSSKFDYINNEIIMTENTSNTFSLLTWLTTLYYLSFIDLKEMENKIVSCQNVFYGPLLCKSDFINNKYKCAYMGTFYWINPMELNLKIKNGLLPKLSIGNRFFAEEYPGYLFNYETVDRKLASHNDIVTDEYVFQNMTKENWNYYFNYELNDHYIEENINKTIEEILVDFYKSE